MRTVSLPAWASLILIGLASAVVFSPAGLRADDDPFTTPREEYFAADRDLDLKEKIVDEVILLGREEAELVLLMARRDMDDAVNTYGRAFTHQLEESQEETAEAVLASSDTLPIVRDRAVRFGHMVERLADAAGTPLDEEQSFDEFLAASEKSALLDVIRARLDDAVDAYGRDFTRQLNVSQKETVHAVLASSDTLLAIRDETVRLGHVAERLADAAETTLYEDQSFDEHLAGLERYAVRVAVLGEVLAQLDDEEIAAFRATNAAREENGLRPLEIDLKLVFTARDHSEDMLTHNFFSHTSPIEGKASPWDRAKRFGTSASGENIYAGGPSGTGAVDAWMNSEGHRANILTPGNRRIGVGRSNGMWTQLFGR